MFIKGLTFGDEFFYIKIGFILFRYYFNITWYHKSMKFFHFYLLFRVHLTTQRRSRCVVSKRRKKPTHETQKIKRASRNRSQLVYESILLSHQIIDLKNSQFSMDIPPYAKRMYYPYRFFLWPLVRRGKEFFETEFTLWHLMWTEQSREEIRTYIPGEHKRDN